MTLQVEKTSDEVRSRVEALLAEMPPALKGFQRVAVDAGASTTVEFTLSPVELSYWSAATRGWVQDATTYDLGVGGDSTVELGSTFSVTG